MFPKPIAGGAVLAGRGSMSPKTIPTLAAFAIRQFESHAKHDNNATRGFKGKGSDTTEETTRTCFRKAGPWAPEGKHGAAF